MIALGLITCIVLRALSAQAKVVDSFEECKEFFYKGVEPRGMDQNAEKICQKVENKGFYFATLYSVNYRIPLYSAYTLDPRCSSDSGKSNSWYLEPRISDPKSTIDHMVLENPTTQDLYKEKQAIGRDYSGSGYDRGHLNPNFFQCGEGRIATFTLTNTAPMNRDFNQKHWNKWERTLRGYLNPMLAKDHYSAKAFIITGTVPDGNVRIPEDDPRVSVPSHIWTAVCYKHNTDDASSFSFGYIGKNNNEDIRLMRVRDLQTELHNLWPNGFSNTIQIFDDGCFNDSNKFNKVQKVFQIKQKEPKVIGEIGCFSSDGTCV